MTTSADHSNRVQSRGTLEILVIEGNPEQLERIRRCLDAPGREHIEIEFALTVQEALEAVRSRKFNCVLVDHRLPDGHGIDVLEALDDELLTTPVIGLSEEDDPSVSIEYFRAGCVDFFIKDDVLNADNLRRGIARAMAAFHRRAMGTVIERRQLGDAVIKSQEGLIALARTDRLMGICNRAVFDDYFPPYHAEALGRDGRYALCMIDVDNFKRYNDTYGHAAGDDVLRTVARVLSAALRENDFIARYGGEELVVLLDEVNAESARSAAGRLSRLIFEQNIPHTGNDPHGRVTVSIGVALFGPDTADNPTAMLSRADAALYQAKGAGRNTVVIVRSDVRDQRMSA